jgi:hypothetical protein
MGIIYFIRAACTDHQVKGNLKLEILNGHSSIFVCSFCLQEAYWRIPGSLNLQDLRKRVEVIGQALDGSYIAQDNSK